MFKKYFTLLKLSWQNLFVYRTSLVMWQVRLFLSSIMALTIWQVIFSNQETVLNYSQQEITTYIFLVAFLQGLVLSSGLLGLTGRIYSGSLSFEMLKPVNLFIYLATEDIADKLQNGFFSLLQAIVLFLIFKPALVWPQLAVLPIFLLWLIMGVLIYYFITLLFGAIGFWSPDSWGPRFLFFMFVDFTAGKLYPLDILPIFLQKIVFLTPFPYFSYLQTQLFLGRVAKTQFLSLSLVMLAWIFILWLIVKLVWGKGWKNYSATGQ